MHFCCFQIDLMKSNAFYQDYAMKLCSVLNSSDGCGLVANRPELLPMTLEPTQLELASVLDLYMEEANPCDDTLLHRLCDVANEMQGYGDGVFAASSGVHKRIGV